MTFDGDYFANEIREGFYVESMMKRVWAAQLVVLQEIDRICKRNGITYFADWGTLLGAIRHKGFIPWDDDVDIAMKRSDYQKFLYIARKELSEGYYLHEVSTHGHQQPFSRVVNSHEISFQKEHIERFYGCYYIVGIDIFPLDFISGSKSEEEVQCQMLIILLTAVEFCKEGMKQQLGEVLYQMEEVFSIRINQCDDVLGELLRLIDRISSLSEEGSQLTLMPYFAQNRDFRLVQH